MGLGLGGAWGIDDDIRSALYNTKVKISNKDGQLLDAVHGVCEAIPQWHLMGTFKRPLSASSAQAQGQSQGQGQGQSQGQGQNQSQQQKGGSGSGSGSGGDSNIAYYQLLHQIWRKQPGVQQQRSLVLTPSVAILGEESLKAIDISFTSHATAPLSLILVVRQEKNNPLAVTFVFRAQGLGMFQGRKKWRLLCGTQAVAVRLLEECRKLGLATEGL